MEQVLEEGIEMKVRVRELRVRVRVRTTWNKS